MNIGRADSPELKSSDRVSMLEKVKRRSGIRKVLLAGSGAVGKTSLLKVLKGNKCLSEMLDGNCTYQRTLFFDIEVIKASEFSEQETRGFFQLIDIAGQLDSPIHALRDIRRTALGAVDVAILVFATDNVQSLLDLTEWLDLLESFYESEMSCSPPLYVLIENKCDLSSSIDRGLVNAILEGDTRISHHFETSCLTGEGLPLLRRWLSDAFSDRGGDGGL